MNQAQSICVNLVLLSATTALFANPSDSYISTLIPEATYAIPSIQHDIDNSYAVKIHNYAYAYTNDRLQLDAILEFAQNFVQNSEELSPDISRAINSHFWELF